MTEWQRLSEVAELSSVCTLDDSTNSSSSLSSSTSSDPASSASSTSSTSSSSTTSSSTSSTTPSTDVSQSTLATDNKDKKKKKRRRDGHTSVNTSIYIQNLPTDVTEEEVAQFCKRGGIIREDPLTLEKKIKLYKDEQGKLKGDALVIYERVGACA